MRRNGLLMVTAARPPEMPALAGGDFTFETRALSAEFQHFETRALASGNPHETISSCVGRNAIAGRAWALRVEPAIDRLFELLGSPPGHCRRSIVRADLTTTPTP